MAVQLKGKSTINKKQGKKNRTSPSQFCDPVTKSHPILQKYFGYCLYKAAMRFRGLLDEALAKHDLMTPQLGILRVIHESGRISQQDVGNFVGIDKTSMVKFIDHLEKIKLVKREVHETDRRVKLLSLTAKAVRTLDEVGVIRQDVESAFLETLDDSERIQIKRIIPKLLP